MSHLPTTNGWFCPSFIFPSFLQNEAVPAAPPPPPWLLPCLGQPQRQPLLSGQRKAASEAKPQLSPRRVPSAEHTRHHGSCAEAGRPRSSGWVIPSLAEDAELLKLMKDDTLLSPFPLTRSGSSIRNQLHLRSAVAETWQPLPVGR